MYILKGAVKKIVEKYKIQDHKSLFMGGIMNMPSCGVWNVGVHFRERGSCCKKKWKYKLRL